MQTPTQSFTKTFLSTSEGLSARSTLQNITHLKHSRFYHILVTRIRYFWLHWDYIFEKTSYFKEQTMIKNITTKLIAEVLY
jgi:hypothetical protein